MKKILAIALIAALSSTAVAKPPVPRDIVNGSVASKKAFCDEAANFAKMVFLTRDLVEIDFISNKLDRFRDNPALLYVMEISLYAGYNARSKEAAYNEAWGACYRYIRFQE